MRRVLALSFLAVFGATPAAGDPIYFKLLPNYSRATFKTDAPLETILGNAGGGGLSGTLAVDPAKPNADMLDPRFLDVAASDAHRFVTFEMKSVEIAGSLEPGKTMPARVSGILTVKQKPVSTVADALVTWVKLGPEHAEAQKRISPLFASNVPMTWT